MKRFAYWRDGLFLASCAGYALNRWGLKPLLATPFLHSYFNDLLLIPCALPPLLWLHRKLGLRLHDLPPTPAEILGHLGLWSVICELLGPHIYSRATGDWHDVLAYATGAVLAALWWHRQRPGLRLCSA